MEMNEIRGNRSDVVFIVEKNEKFGIEDKDGNVILPARYECVNGVECNAKGRSFIFSEKGKWGYIEVDTRNRSMEYGYGAVNGCAKAYLSCIYSYIDVRKNGLSLYIERDGDEFEYWFDARSRILYRDVMFVKNFTDFDYLLVESGELFDFVLKKAGEDVFATLESFSSLNCIDEIPMDNVGFRCIISVFDDLDLEEEGEGVDENDACGYFCIFLFKDGWLVTDPKPTLTELYSELPTILKRLEERKEGEMIWEDTPLNPYKKKSEIYFASEDEI